MLDRAAPGAVLGDGNNSSAGAAPIALTVENFPGICLGASMLCSLGLHKVGYGALTEKEGEALTAALLKNAEAWDLGNVIANPRAAAALDLLGVFVHIVTPRVLADRGAPASAALAPAA